MSTLIIGGGLSGLALADKMESLGLDYHLLEARSRLGGRILTEQFGDAYLDMGPAWFWPGQARIASLIDRLGLNSFEQYADGDLTYEDEYGQVQRGRGFSSMQGSLRVDGGLTKLTDELASRIPDKNKELNAIVKRIEWDSESCLAKLSDKRIVRADRIVLAMPPRLASELDFDPPLLPQAIETMRSTPTWMAGQAKAVAVYDTPFWRNAGLSGDAMSRRGPMVEIHDASPNEGGHYALFGFVGVPTKSRHDVANLKRSVRDQLVRLFGQNAAKSSALFLQDWAFDPFTATIADHAPQYGHPSYGLPHSLRGLWEGNLVFAGTEVASTFGGYLEGALEAAGAALEKICTRPSAS